MKKYHYLLLIFLLLCGIGYGLQRIMDSKVKDDSQEITVVEDTEETNLDEGVEVMGK